MLLEEVAGAVDRLIRPGEAGAVALSGGGDSLCLLHVLTRLAGPRGLRISAIHVDHGLRPESARQAQEVVALARGLGVETSVLRAGLAPDAPGNLQQRARSVRQRLIEEQARRLSLGWVAVGHTATDQAELVLMRAVRGTGPSGLGGMAWSRPMGSGGRLVRPLLGQRREDVASYLGRHGLTPVLDPTNETPRYLRNRVRQRVLPLLAAENPAVVAALCRLATTCREEDEALLRLAQQALASAEAPGGLAVARLQELPRGLLHRVLRLAHARAVGTTRRLDRGHVERVACLVAETGGSARVDLPGARVERRYGTLVWMAGGDPGQPQLAPFTVETPGRYPLSDGRVLEVVAGSAQGHPPWEVLSFGVGFPLLVRPPRAGDRIAIGPGRHKKVHRVLMDAKIPRAGRGSFPVVVADDVVVLLPGLRRGYGLGPGEGEALVVRLLAGA